jgi:Flp pilus assembly protein TadB
MPSQRPYAEIRASDAERERVVAFLREHALQGRLNHDELEERIGLAYAAVYVGDLERLVRDLPRPSAPAARRHPAPARRHRPTPALILAGIALLFITGVPMVVMAGLIAAVAVLVALSFALGPFILIALIIVLASRRGHRAAAPPRWHRV